MNHQESGLGPLIGTYPAGPRKRLSRCLVVLGVTAIVAVPGIAGVVTAFNLPPGDAVPVPLLIPAAIAIFIGIYGVVLAAGVWQRRGERFDLYEGGFVRHAGGRDEVVAWHDIETAQAAEDPVNWFLRLMGQDYFCEVVKTDGRTIRMDGLTPHARTLGPVISRRAREEFERRVPEALAAGEIVPFGRMVAVSREGLYAGGKMFPWSQLPELKDDPLRLELGPQAVLPLLPSHPGAFRQVLDRLRPARTTPPPGGVYPDSPRTPAGTADENSAGCLFGLMVVMGLFAVIGGLFLLFTGEVEADFVWFAWMLIVSPFVCLGLYPLLKRPTPWGWLVSLAVLAGLAVALVVPGEADDGLAIRLFAATPLAFMLVMLLRPPVVRYYLRSGRAPG